jgi:hypothetical protein
LEKGMAQYIDKSDLVAEIENKINKIDLNSIEDWRYRLQREHDIEVMKNIISIINTFEVKEADTWHLQEKENVYDAVKDWSLHTFVCIMKDGTIQRFTGNMDEDCEGHINVHVNGVNDDYDDVDDIVKWTELT